MSEEEHMSQIIARFERMDVELKLLMAWVDAFNGKLVILNKRFTHHINLMDAHKEPVRG